MGKNGSANPHREWTFNPWNPGPDVEFEGVRLLILGESHYDDSDSPETDPAVIAKSTIQAVRDWSARREHRGQRFFPYIYETVTGETWEPGSSMVTDFWRSICFYNYVQEFVGRRARIRPTPAMFRRSDGAFFAVLQALKPDAVLVLGEGLWQSMADSDDPGPSLPQGLGQTYWFNAGDGRRSLSAHIRHPSAPGFSPRRYHPPVKEFLDLCQREKSVFLKA